MDKKQLIDVLLKLKAETAALQPNPSEETLRALIRKYDMVFSGERFSKINSLELCHTMNDRLEIPVTNEELSDAIPDVCATLGMKVEPLIKLEDSGTANPAIYGYYISLY